MREHQVVHNTFYDNRNYDVYWCYHTVILFTIHPSLPTFYEKWCCTNKHKICLSVHRSKIFLHFILFITKSRMNFKHLEKMLHLIEDVFQFLLFLRMFSDWCFGFLRCWYRSVKLYSISSLNLIVYLIINIYLAIVSCVLTWK